MTPDAETTTILTPSHRSTINLRLWQAEAGLWLPLVDDLLQAHIEFHQQSSPKLPTWKTECARAAFKSLSGSWSLAFRALQEDNCPPPSQETFDKVALKFICSEVSAQEQATLSAAAAKAKRTCNKHLAQKITHTGLLPTEYGSLGFHLIPVAPMLATRTLPLFSKLPTVYKLPDCGY